MHGSIERDIDLVAVPWRDGATSGEELAYDIFRACEAVLGSATWSGGWSEDQNREPTLGSLRNPDRKPHGRLGWVIMVPGTYIDLSVMPREAVKESK